MNRTQVAAMAAILVFCLSIEAYGQPTSPSGIDQSTPMQRAPSGGAPGSTASKTDEDFVRRAVIANRFEVAEGEIAIQKATDPKLRSFAEMMVRDHGAALTSLAEAAKAAGVNFPASIDLDAAHQTKVDALRPRKEDFDQAYLTDQAAAHREALALLDTYRTSGGNERLRAWAGGAIEVVRTHQRALQELGAR